MFFRRQGLLAVGVMRVLGAAADSLILPVGGCRNGFRIDKWAVVLSAAAGLCRVAAFAPVACMCVGQLPTVIADVQHATAGMSIPG